MQEGKASLKDKTLVGVFVILCVAIAGLIAGLVVLNINTDKNENRFAECIERETYNDMIDCINNAYLDDNNKELAVETYDTVINNAVLKDDYISATNLVRARTDFLVENEQCEEAMRLLRGEDLSNYGVAAKNYLYAHAAELSIDCQDRQSEAEWRSLIIIREESEIEDL